uniref:Uncharacterized protein n=1 Tax=Vespula pensylvanica TaxID=30213 RepID=A0A834PG91_VESPE|nr:hypothetical protein H0235_001545 [Vespula pensylvanica]
MHRKFLWKLFFYLQRQPTIFGTVASDLNPKDGNSRRVSHFLFSLGLDKPTSRTTFPKIGLACRSVCFAESKQNTFVFAEIRRREGKGKTKRNSRMMWVMISRELSLGNGLGVMARAELRSLHLISSLPAAGSVLPSS